jgi:hypothetical protein
MKVKAWWVLLGVSLAAAITVVAIPAVLIQPFRSQSEADVALGYGLRQAAPLVTLVAFAVVALASWRLARATRGWRRILPLAGLALAAGAGWFARQNYFEWMFAPLPTPSYVRASQADFVRPDDMVLGVVVNDDAVAYPVNQLAYHHVVNDEVGGIPIAATY